MLRTAAPATGSHRQPHHALGPHGRRQRPLADYRGQPGIPTETVPQVFQKFIRVRSGDTAGTRGTGIGLAAARGFAEAHGGSLVAYGLPRGAAHGTLIELRLPARTVLPAPQEMLADLQTERGAA